MQAFEWRIMLPTSCILSGAQLIRRFIFIATACFSLIPGAQTTPVAKSHNTQDTFLPVAVWYSGGTARAPMLEPITVDSERRWSEDLQKIKGLGFNTVRTWVEWNVGEPREGEYHLENLDLLLKLANEAGLKVIVQVYVDSAP